MAEKHLQHQQNLFHNFIDFRKAFDRVWHDGLWHVLRSFGIDESIIQVICALYKQANSAVILDNEIGGYFRTAVGVRQGCLLSPVLFNLFLENIMREVLHTFNSSVSIGGRAVSNLRFADDIDLIAKSNEELQDLPDRLVDRAGAYGMEVSSEKSKVMVNSLDAPPINIIMNGETLEEVDAFKYLGSTMTKDGRSDKEISIRLAQATSAMSKLNKVWRSSSISFPVKIRLYRALVVTILLYGCESWTLSAATSRKVEAFEMKSYRRLLHIHWTEHRTNEFVLGRIADLAGAQEPLLSVVRRRKLSWYGHVTRQDNSLAKTILQGTLEGGRRRGRPRKLWMDNIHEWTGLDSPTLLRKAEDRKIWRRLTRTASSFPPDDQPVMRMR